MTEITLKYADADGIERQVALESFPSIVGRHSENDVAIPDPRLSRQHLRLELRNGGVYAEDLGSSNGTTLNSRPIDGLTLLADGDRLELGGLPVAVSIRSEAATDRNVNPPLASPSTSAAQAQPKTSSGRTGPKGLPVWLIFMAPVAALLLVLVAGALAFVFTSPGPNANLVAENRDANSDDSTDPTPAPSDDSPGSATNSGSNDANASPDANSSPASPPANLSGTAKIEQYGSIFMRKIAMNEPRAFLTGDQAKIVDDRIKQIASSSALAANIDSARKNAADIKAVAAAKNIKPLFLATAAINKLGTNRGDVLATAKGMAEVFDKLAIQIGNEFADDCLLMIAAYDQGAAGNTMQMRNMLQDLATKAPQSARTIRTIWFLQKQGKITAGEYSQAVNFLAIGTITQNPKEFGVNTQALDL